MSTTMEKATPAEPGRGSLILKSGIALAVGSAAFLVKYLLNRDSYEGMESIVSFSSRMIAAARALEDDEESKVTFDPLAKFMAGTKAIGRARKRRVKAPEGSGRQYKVGRIAVRTRWFDDQLEECLGMPRTFSPSEDARHIVTTLVPGADGRMHLPTQVVELGAGLSTRPWRLHLPAVLRWFDVDRQDVIDVRENLLIKHGAEVDMMSPIRRSESKNSILERQIGSLDHHSVNVEFPLRCESRTSVAADVGEPDWIKALIAAGFDASKPTVWIAEGLLMYLERGRVDALLREIASLSADGSCFLTGVVTENCITKLSEKKGVNPLMKEWKSGVPQDPAPWLKNLGWDSRLVITRAEIAEALGLGPDTCSFDTTQEAASKGFFIVATTVHESL